MISNIVEIIGILAEDPIATEMGDTEVLVSIKENNKLNEVIVRIPFMLKDLEELKKGTQVLIAGSIVSEKVEIKNPWDKRVKVFVKANVIQIKGGKKKNRNKAYIEGCVHKEPYYISTKMGERVTEFIMINQEEGKVALIPLICIGGIAVEAAKLKMGQRFNVSGKMQSREYIKKVEGTEHTVIAYEVLVEALNYI